MIDDGRGDRGADHIVSIYARTNQIEMLRTLTWEMDVWMHETPQRILGAGIIVEYACGDANVAEEFLARWSALCDKSASTRRTRTAST